MIDFDAMIKNVESLTNEFNSVREDFFLKYKVLLENSIKECFKDERIKRISWNQYSPYFNDGEPCSFQVNTWSLAVNGQREDDLDDLDEDAVEVDREVIEKIRNLLEQFPDDFLENEFGDGVEISYTPEGKTVEDYTDHD